MKTTGKFLTLAATALLFGGAAFGDDPTLQHRLALQRQQVERDAPTVAFYSRGKGLGRTTKQTNELRVKEKFQPHGTALYLLVPKE